MIFQARSEVWQSLPPRAASWDVCSQSLNHYVTSPMAPRLPYCEEAQLSPCGEMYGGDLRLHDETRMLSSPPPSQNHHPTPGSGSCPHPCCSSSPAPDYSCLRKPPTPATATTRNIS